MTSGGAKIIMIIIYINNDNIQLVLAVEAATAAKVVVTAEAAITVVQWQQ